MTFWSTDTLKQKLPDLIIPCDLSKIEQASYTLQIGSEIFITKDRHNDNSQHTKRSLAENQAFVIPPGQFAFLLTEECVAVPNNAIAFISMKASFKYKGLINISGFHVDPGFKGKLLFSVYNAGPSPIHLQQNEPFFLIWYANLDQVDSKPRDKKGFSEIPIKVLNEISTDEVYSIHALTTKVSSIEEKYNSVIWWTSFIKNTGRVLLAVFIAVIPLVWSNFDTIREYYTAINQLVADQRKQSQSIESTAKSQGINNNNNTLANDQDK